MNISSSYYQDVTDEHGVCRQDLPAVRNVVQNIMADSIPEATKKGLLKPLLLRPVPPPCKRKQEKRKAVLQEFDPLHTETRHKLRLNRKELLPLAAAKQNLTALPVLSLIKSVGDTFKEQRSCACRLSPRDQCFSLLKCHGTTNHNNDRK